MMKPLCFWPCCLDLDRLKGRGVVIGRFMPRGESEGRVERLVAERGGGEAKASGRSENGSSVSPVCKEEVLEKG